MNIEERTYQSVQYLFAKPSTVLHPPVVMVHGAYNNAHIWASTFMPYFVEKGHEVYAIHLKNQETVSAPITLFNYRLGDYVQSLHTLTEILDEKPWFIGHSMGGLVVQLYVSQYPDSASAICLLASLPPFGMKNTLLQMLLKPITLLKFTLLTLSPPLTRLGRIPKGLLSERGERSGLLHLRQVMERESVRTLLGSLNPPVQTNRVNSVPLAIVGAELDILALPKDVEKMGRIYGEKIRIFPDMGHLMMFEPEWEAVADEIVHQLHG